MEHPISELMQTAMSSMKDMVDVNTVVGHPVQASSGSTIIPISRVTFGYMTAGGDLLADKPAKDAPDFPFAGGSGAGVSVQPVGFLVLSGDTVRTAPRDLFKRRRPRRRPDSDGRRGCEVFPDASVKEAKHEAETDSFSPS